MRAILEAGRSMLNYKSVAQEWVIINKQNLSHNNNEDDSLIPSRIVKYGPHFNSTLILNLKPSSKGCNRNTPDIQWHLPLKMNDGITCDQWYPYIYLTNGDKCQHIATGRMAQSEYKSDSRFLVHADDLKEGDTIDVLPSTFDFEYLDTSGRRFEIHYGKNGRRARQTRPFYLEDLDRFAMIWSQMKYLKKTQRYQVVQVIEATRQRWYGDDRESMSIEDPVFRQFVTDTLANAEWTTTHAWNTLEPQQKTSLSNAGVTGELADLAELHLEILKEQ